MIQLNELLERKSSLEEKISAQWEGRTDEDEDERSRMN